MTFLILDLILSTFPNPPQHPWRLCEAISGSLSAGKELPFYGTDHFLLRVLPSFAHVLFSLLDLAFAMHTIFNFLQGMIRCYLSQYTYISFPLRKVYNPQVCCSEFSITFIF